MGILRGKSSDRKATLKSETPRGPEIWLSRGSISLERFETVTTLSSQKEHSPMDGKRQELEPQTQIIKIISTDRISTYINASGHNLERALLLYLWNAKIGEAFHLPIQAIEIALRNRVNDALRTAFNDEWWVDQNFLNIATEFQQQQLNKTIQTLKFKSLPVNNGQVVANLSLGYWVSALEGRFNSKVWSKHLRVISANMSNPAKPLFKLHSRARHVKDLRNRISHHEPLIRRNLSQDFGYSMELLHWLCPEKASWIRPHCRVQKLLRDKP